MNKANTRARLPALKAVAKKSTLHDYKIFIAILARRMKLLKKFAQKIKVVLTEKASQ